MNVQDSAISVQHVDGEDYISLTDMARGEEGSEDRIKNWMRNRNTIEFLGLWETMHNPDFKPVEFDRFRKEAGLNSFTLRPQKWIEATNAKGIISKSGRYGGTYAHRDIAFEFGSWISPSFKLYLIKEYQRLKEIETNQYNLEWNVKRVLSKANYTLHTDAVKAHIIPQSKRVWNKSLEYAEEADLINVAIFGCTAKEWKDANPERAKAGENMRDSASINELNVLANAESHNAEMIREGLSKEARFNKLKDMVTRQLEALNSKDFIKSLKKTSQDTYLQAPKNDEDSK
ncbi:KilA-N domain-containing protein [Candidatus Marinamargulisbacteria bacterium]|nr:KilA-N domain-containing protein [Candidatus Marinamargulisbacteria bacterium]